MINLRNLKKRIQTVRNTQHITKAMKMVSASKLKRSQVALLSLRPYAYKIASVLNSIKDKIDPSEYPLLRKREVKRVRILVVSSDRGLCGSYNANIIKRVESYLREENLNSDNSVLDFVGKKGYKYLKKKYSNIGSHYEIEKNPTYEDISDLGEGIIYNYIKGDFDSFVIIYNEFKSALVQKVTVEKLLPIVTPDYAEHEEFLDIDKYLYEASKEDIVNVLLPKYIKIETLRVLLEALASECGARMVAMDNATKNSEEMLRKLLLIYNRQRQATITAELSEIMGGKEALEQA